MRIHVTRPGRLASLLCGVLAATACSESTPTGPARGTPKAPVAAAIALGATPLAIDERGVPRLLATGGVAAAPAASVLESARLHVQRLAPAWGVHGGLPELAAIADVPVPGGRVARLRQILDGLPIDRGELRLLVKPGGGLLAASGVLYGVDTPRVAARFTEDDTGAIARAVAHTRGSRIDRGALVAKWNRDDGTRVVGGTASGFAVELARAQQVWYPVDRLLVAAWVVEAYTSPTGSTDSELHRTVLSADGTRVLEHRSLTADVAFKYRVWAEPTGEAHPLDGPTADTTPHPAGAPNGTYPGYTAPSLVTVDGLNDPNGTGVPDPWLGSTRTETQGNNVEAYADFNAPSGLSFGDFRATTTAAREFDRVYDTAAAPLTSQAQQMAAITSLFYSINWLHDFWYDAGFTEASGNGQDSNYGRGGDDRDAILAEAQDNALGGSRNNANMSTPSDGLPPRMQVFLWSGKTNVTLAVHPAGRTPPAGTAAFGPTSFDLSAGVMLANDGAGPNPSDGCTALPDATGKIVLVDRGNCTFKVKALNIQNANGVGMLLANNMASSAPPGMGGDPNTPTDITIASLSVTMDEGTALKAELAAGPITARLFRQTGVELDGGVDATLVAHEFGHYLHHRLALCGNKMCGAISEGWADFVALMLLARAGDDLDGAFPFSIYTTQSFSADPAYYGIRRAPYSVNPAINALSFRHMADGEPLPTTHPFLASGQNSQVHNGGEIWASAMWEAYVALQKAGGATFEEIRDRMAKYIVGGLLMMPVEASPTEARDAILAVVGASSPADHDIIAAGFARRGFGSCAISPAPESQDFVGIVESTVVAGRVLAGAETTEATQACDDDTVLDAGEAMRITVPISNRGHLALTDLTATLTSTTEGITVTSAPSTIASLAPYATAQITADIALAAGGEVPVAGDFALTITAAGGCTESTTLPVALRLNVDDITEAATTDTFDTAASVWTPAGDPLPAWSHVRDSALDGAWHGADLGTRSDTSLVSPIFTVGEGPLSIAFQHRHDFELGGGVAFDGAVIEYTTDSGTTWTDISTLASPGYNATLDPNNALGARMAFTGKNPSHPLVDTVTLELGTQLAGAQVQLRFRIGTDGGAGAPGWDLDDVVFTGIVGTPFPMQVADDGSCDGDTDPTPADEGGCCDAGPIGAGNLAAALGVLGLVLRRRRRGAR